MTDIEGFLAIYGHSDNLLNNKERIFAHEGTEVWKRENRPFRAFSSSIWNAKEC